MDEVPPGQPPGLGDETVQPLKAAPLDQRVRSVELAGRDRNRSAASDEPGAWQVPAQPGYQPLLLGEAEADEDDLRLALDQLAADVIDVAGLGVERERGRVRAGDLQSLVARGKPVRRHLRGTGATVLTWHAAEHVDRP